MQRISIYGYFDDSERDYFEYEAMVCCSKEEVDIALDMDDVFYAFLDEPILGSHGDFIVTSFNSVMFYDDKDDAAIDETIAIKISDLDEMYELLTKGNAFHFNGKTFLVEGM